MEKVTHISEVFYSNLNSVSLGVLTATGHFISPQQTPHSTAAEHMFEERGKRTDFPSVPIFILDRLSSEAGQRTRHL